MTEHVDAARQPFPVPPLRSNAAGDERRVGVELEFGDLDLDVVTGILADHLGGEVQRQTRYVHRVSGDPAGVWQVERDAMLLKDNPGPDPGQGEALSVAEEVMELIRRGAEQLVPLEVVSPPLPMHRLPEIDIVVERLRLAGAAGTGRGLGYAFALQLNPEMPALSAACVTAYLRAFLVCFDWLKRRTRLDLTRRLTTYVDPYPRAYVRRVMSAEYAPDLAALMDHYLLANPTRNRPLDFLPLFAELDFARVRRSVDDPLVKPRPALHYRLPNCEIDRPDWGVWRAWQDWLQVEHLAADRARLAAACADYAAYLDGHRDGFMQDWADRVQLWLLPPPFLDRDLPAYGD